MDELSGTFNALVAAATSLVLGWAVLTPRIRDGVVIKSGLILMALGFASIALALVDGQTCDDVRALGRSEALVNMGVLIVAAGWAIRTKVGRVKRRRSCDWRARNDP